MTTTVEKALSTCFLVPVIFFLMVTSLFITELYIQNHSLTRNSSTISMNNDTNDVHDINWNSYFDTKVASIEELKQQLLCQVNINHPKYEKYMQLLSYIYRTQFKQSEKECYDDPATKYLILESPCNQRGMFAQLICWMHYVSEAVINHRVLLFHSKYNFAQSRYCKNVTSADTTQMECFFLPMSSCHNVTHLLNTHIRKQVDGTKILFIYENNRIPQSLKFLGLNRSYLSWKKTRRGHTFGVNNRIIYVGLKHTRGALRSVRYRNKLQTRFGLSESEFSAFITAFLLRQQPTVSRQVSLAILHSLYNTQWNPHTAASAMVRWSDKCWNAAGAGHGSHGEMDCFSIDEYTEIISKAQKYFIPNMSHAIVTSESEEIISKAKANNFTNFDFIFNLHDVMQGGSEIKFRWVKKREHSATEIMVSMLSTIKLQFGAHYYFIKTGSIWNSNIYSMAKNLDCLPISTRELSKIEDEIDSINVTKQGFDEFYNYIREQEMSQANDRQIVHLLSDGHGNQGMFHGQHIVSWNAQFTQLKNDKFSKDYDWHYESSNKTHNKWADGSHGSY